MSLWSIVIGVFFGSVFGIGIGWWAESLMDDELSKFEHGADL